MASIADQITAGCAALGIEFGSTRIKAVLIDTDQQPVATGSHAWASKLVDGYWTYDLDEVWSGVQDAFARLAAEVRQRYSVELTRLAGFGVSAMMHGYLAFDAADEPLAGFRTWQNTHAGEAAAALTAAFGVNVPMRWSVAQFYQAVLDAEPHVARVRHLATLSAYVHHRLTGRRVLGVGDASGMFPLDGTRYHLEAARAFDALTAAQGVTESITDLLPDPLPAGADAGTLTPAGALLLDPTGTLLPGCLAAPPEGDAGTGMVATHAVAPRTGNVSVGTSVFAMVVLDSPLTVVDADIDPISTPDGSAVAMVHCNNGSVDLGQWMAVFGETVAACGSPVDADLLYERLLTTALAGDADCGGVTSINFVYPEPIVGAAGQPWVTRSPDAQFTLANLMRSQLFAVFASLRVGMARLAAQGVRVDALVAHGGLFRTSGVAQRLMAAALNTPIMVDRAADQGGAWGMALLARLRAAGRSDLSVWLDEVFASSQAHTVNPSDAEVAGFERYLARFVSILTTLGARSDAVGEAAAFPASFSSR